MPESAPTHSHGHPLPGADLQVVGEPVEGVVVETNGPGQLPASPRPPGVQAVVAATGFMAGAATVAILRRRRTRRALRARRTQRPDGDLVRVLGSRSFLVDIHLLGGRD